MGVRVHPGGDADQHVGHRPETLAVSDFEAIELVEGVDDDPPDTRFDCEPELLITLVVPVKHAGRGGHPGM